jgi:hypothetical protein
MVDLLEVQTNKIAERPAYELGKLAYAFVAFYEAQKVPDADKKLIYFTDHFGEKYIDWLVTLDRLVNQFGHIWTQKQFISIAEINNWFVNEGTNKLAENQYWKDYSLGWISVMETK